MMCIVSRVNRLSTVNNSWLIKPINSNSFSMFNKKFLLFQNPQHEAPKGMQSTPPASARVDLLISLSASASFTPV